MSRQQTPEDDGRQARSPIHRVAEAALTAAEEVQRLSIGYPGEGSLAYGDEADPAPGLVVDHHDPLDEATWTVGGDTRGTKDPYSSSSNAASTSSEASKFA